MLEALRSWLTHQGFPADTEVTAMQRGLGGTTLWRVVPDPADAQLVARVFQPGGAAAAEREAAAMRAAADGGVPVPAVLLLGEMDTWPVLLTTHAGGTPASEVLRAEPERAATLGRAMGAALGRLHTIAAPAALREGACGWIARAGDAVSPLRERLVRLPDTDRLLHLDFHPANVLVDDDGVTAIVDWENTLAGPPFVDLARTQALLWALRAGEVTGVPPEALATFETAMVAAHRTVMGPDPYPALTSAWGMAMTAADLAQHLGKPGSWLTRETIGAIRDERDRRILAALDSSAP